MFDKTTKETSGQGKIRVLSFMNSKIYNQCTKKMQTN
jgi:hypothetical protein